MSRRVSIRDVTRVWVAAFLGAVSLAPADAAVGISIDPDAGHAAISPYIYGTNQDIAGVNFTLRRSGGNRMTGYNWENNASNAGSDYLHQSDNFLTWVSGIPDGQAGIPGIVLTRFHDQSLAAHALYQFQNTDSSSPSNRTTWTWLLSSPQQPACATIPSFRTLGSNTCYMACLCNIFWGQQSVTNGL